MYTRSVLANCTWMSVIGLHKRNCTSMNNHRWHFVRDGGSNYTVSSLELSFLALIRIKKINFSNFVVCRNINDKLHMLLGSSFFLLFFFLKAAVCYATNPYWCQLLVRSLLGYLCLQTGRHSVDICVIQLNSGASLSLQSLL